MTEKRINKSDFVTSEAFRASFSPAARARIDARAKQMVAEELTLRDLRKACDLTQEQIGSVLKISQDQVSKLEKRSDMLLSTLGSYVKAMGGELSLVVQFPDRPPVVLSSLTDVFESGGPKPRRGRKKSDDRMPV